jgi:signal transduction histidine kinase
LTDPLLSFPDQPRVELDRRIADLVGAANEVLAAQGRLRELLRANHAITAQLELDSVLRTIVDSARSLTGAESVALGVLDGHGGFEQVIRAPRRSDDTAEPTGAEDLQQTLSARNVLTVPLRVGAEAFGDLYLTSEQGVGFSEEDEQLVRSLAATAGFAVEHARLYRETQQREEFAAASAAVTAALLGENSDRALSLVADRLRTLLGADSVFVTLMDDEGLRLDVVAVEGRDPNSRRHTQLPVAGSVLERVLPTRTAIRIDERSLREMRIPSMDQYGSLMALPLDTPERMLGAIVVTRAPGGRAFTETDLTVADDFAGRTSVALELHHAREGQGRVRLFEERGRIARDLHDRVIQQLFATGMQLQGVLGTLPDGRNAERVDAAITNLDATIAQIRRIIFTLSSPERADGPPSGRHRLLDLVGELETSLSVEPAIGFAGPVDAFLDAELTEDLLAVVTEGVTNAVRHGGATEVAVRIAATPAGIRATVTSDGRPMTAETLSGAGRRSGLANLSERANRRGGEMRLQNADGRTVLEWSAPARPSTASPER